MASQPIHNPYTKPFTQPDYPLSIDGEGQAVAVSSLGASHSLCPNSDSEEGILINLRDIRPGDPMVLSESAFVSDSSTPLKARLASYDADHKLAIKSPITCREVGQLLLKEFPSDLVLEHSTLGSKLFPSRSFSYGSEAITLKDSNFLASMRAVWSSSTNNWRHLPTDGTESSVAYWLNSVGKEFSRVAKIPIQWN
jgi:hypothetical protein